jgi:GntR family transcriptional regulator/MocR family aminotransferase
VAGDENTIVARAREAGVGIGGLAPYFTSRPSMRGFMFGYGSIDDRAIREGLARLRRALP